MNSRCTCPLVALLAPRRPHLAEISVLQPLTCTAGGSNHLPQSSPSLSAPGARPAPRPRDRRLLCRPHGSRRRPSRTDSSRPPRSSPAPHLARLSSPSHVQPARPDVLAAGPPHLDGSGNRRARTAGAAVGTWTHAGQPTANEVAHEPAAWCREAVFHPLTAGQCFSYPSLPA